MTNVYPITPITRSSPQTRIGHKPVNTIVTTVELNSLCAFFLKIYVKLDAAHSSHLSLGT